MRNFVLYGTTLWFSGLQRGTVSYGTPLDVNGLADCNEELCTIGALLDVDDLVGYSEESCPIIHHLS